MGEGEEGAGTAAGGFDASDERPGAGTGRRQPTNAITSRYAAEQRIGTMARRQRPNRGRQWRAQRSCASPLHAGLGHGWKTRGACRAAAGRLTWSWVFRREAGVWASEKGARGLPLVLARDLEGGRSARELARVQERGGERDACRE